MNSAPRRIEQSPGQESREKSRVAESSLSSRPRSVMSVDLHPRKRPSEASEMIEGSLISRRQSGENADVRSGRTSRITSPRKERVDTVYSGWEEPNFIRRPARKSSPVPQEEMSLTDYADLPPITQHERKSDRENPLARTRIRPEPPLSPLRKNEAFRKNRPSRYSMETPCIHVDQLVDHTTIPVKLSSSKPLREPRRRTATETRTHRDTRAPRYKTRMPRRHQCVQPDDDLEAHITRPRDA